MPNDLQIDRIDRFARRNVSIAAHALLALAALGLALIARLDGPIALVYTLIVVSGVGRAFAQPSTTTLLAQLLTPAEYQNAYAWLVSSGKIAQVAGPAAGGALIAVTGEAASSYVVAALANLLFVATLTVNYTTNGVQRAASGSPATITFTVLDGEDDYLP